MQISLGLPDPRDQPLTLKHLQAGIQRLQGYYQMVKKRIRLPITMAILKFCQYWDQHVGVNIGTSICRCQYWDQHVGVNIGTSMWVSILGPAYVGVNIGTSMWVSILEPACGCQYWDQHMYWNQHIWVSILGPVNIGTSIWVSILRPAYVGVIYPIFGCV